ncbi:glycosyltransferase involved in cell wall biosynthesis [Pontibacter aydingkolensis]|uniref:Uncharacterized protein n=1 Tax=Pontibacter aydingkolensis TaxID=1911536 RepID=A0ABS7CRG7_9BACT|nr:hypothetical protein [Pontibacter aydingkolensis]MBW7466430.1 hypothetical protein [Pontibacter aydingkolensis]
MKKLRIVFIGYWSINDGLTIATILPWLGVMQASNAVEEIILCTIERDSTQVKSINTVASLSKVEHQPLYPLKSKYPLLTKISDFVQFPREISEVAAKYKATTLFAHGAPAGALAYKVWKQVKLPFYVSSFEPHASYMAESEVWSRTGLKYNFQKYWEAQQLKFASGLIPVSENYRKHLISKGVAGSKIKTVSSPVQAEHFVFDAGQRGSIREKLNWQNNLIGLYTGKYGGLYYQNEAFEIYATCFKMIPSFRLIILTPHPKDEIYTLLKAQNINLEHVLVKQVPHTKVPLYLSAADFAFATYKPGPSKKYLSPVKIGEYWANGLPVLLTEGIGDDSDIIMNEGGGALFDMEQEGSLQQAIRQILEIIKDPQHRQKIPKLALKYRSPDKLREAFEYFLGEPDQEVKV